MMTPLAAAKIFMDALEAGDADKAASVCADSVTVVLPTLIASDATTKNQLPDIDIIMFQISGGMAFRQQGPPFSAASLTGSFVFSAAGFAGENADALAIFVSDGKGSLSGTADLNSVGAPQADLALSGSYSFNGNSGNATLKNPSSTANLALYPVSNSQVLTLSLDSNAIMIGSIEQQ